MMIMARLKTTAYILIALLLSFCFYRYWLYGPFPSPSPVTNSGSNRYPSSALISGSSSFNQEYNERPLPLVQRQLSPQQYEEGEREGEGEGSVAVVPDYTLEEGFTDTHDFISSTYSKEELAALQLNHLFPKDLARFNRCIYLQQQLNHSTLPSNCHFMNGTNRAPVALVSFPGSGNTWVRGLLEMATGICTGSIYCDSGLRRKGFVGEGVASSVSLVTKTHKRIPEWTFESKTIFSSRNKISVHFGSAILLLRNPYDALVSEWNRRLGSKVIGDRHTSFGGPEDFVENEDWLSFVEQRSMRWRNYFTSFILMDPQKLHPVMVARYEDIQKDPAKEIHRMLQFLGFGGEDRGMGLPLITEDEVRERLQNGFDLFHRSKEGRPAFQHYTRESASIVYQHIQSVVQHLISKNHHQTYGVEEYLNARPSIL